MVPPEHEPLPNRLLDDGIAISTVNPFTHSALVVEQDGQLVIVEALWHVTVSPLDKYAATGWRFRTDLTPTQQGVLSNAALSKVGQLYGVASLWVGFLRDDLKIDIHPKLDPQHMDCSELVHWAFLQAGHRLTYAPRPSPADLSYSPRGHGPRPWDRPAS